MQLILNTQEGRAMTVKQAPPPHPSGDKRFKLPDAAMKRHAFQPNALLEILHTAQELFGFLEDDLLIYVGRSLRVPLSRVYGVATFYNFFSLSNPRANIPAWSAWGPHVL
jgi:bidirectional [NiFe] hydrogenase diaphorase subunit